MPRASARSRVRPASSPARPWIGERAFGASAVTISVPASVAASRRATRWIVSPSGIGRLRSGGSRPSRATPCGARGHQGFSLRPVLNSHCAQPTIATVTRAVKPKASAMLTSLLPRKP